MGISARPSQDKRVRTKFSSHLMRRYHLMMRKRIPNLEMDNKNVDKKFGTTEKEMASAKRPIVYWKDGNDVKKKFKTTEKEMTPVKHQIIYLEELPVKQKKVFYTGRDNLDEKFKKKYEEKDIAPKIPLKEGCTKELNVLANSEISPTPIFDGTVTVDDELEDISINSEKQTVSNSEELNSFRSKMLQPLFRPLSPIKSPTRFVQYFTKNDSNNLFLDYNTVVSKEKLNCFVSTPENITSKEQNCHQNSIVSNCDEEMFSPLNSESNLSKTGAFDSLPKQSLSSSIIDGKLPTDFSLADKELHELTFEEFREITEKLTDIVEPTPAEKSPPSSIEKSPPSSVKKSAFPSIEKSPPSLVKTFSSFSVEKSPSFSEKSLSFLVEKSPSIDEKFAYFSNGKSSIFSNQKSSSSFKKMDVLLSPPTKMCKLDNGICGDDRKSLDTNLEQPINDNNSNVSKKDTNNENIFCHGNFQNVSESSCFSTLKNKSRKSFYIPSHNQASFVGFKSKKGSESYHQEEKSSTHKTELSHLNVIDNTACKKISNQNKVKKMSSQFFNANHEIIQTSKPSTKSKANFNLKVSSKKKNAKTVSQSFTNYSELLENTKKKYCATFVSAGINSSNQSESIDATLINSSNDKLKIQSIKEQRSKFDSGNNFSLDVDVLKNPCASLSSQHLTEAELLNDSNYHTLQLNESTLETNDNDNLYVSKLIDKVEKQTNSCLTVVVKDSPAFNNPDFKNNLIESISKDSEPQTATELSVRNMSVCSSIARTKSSGKTAENYALSKPLFNSSESKVAKDLLSKSETNIIGTESTFSTIPATKITGSLVKRSVLEANSALSISNKSLGRSCQNNISQHLLSAIDPYSFGVEKVLRNSGLVNLNTDLDNHSSLNIQADLPSNEIIHLSMPTLSELDNSLEQGSNSSFKKCQMDDLADDFSPSKPVAQKLNLNKTAHENQNVSLLENCHCVEIKETSPVLNNESNSVIEEEIIPIVDEEEIVTDGNEIAMNADFEMEEINKTKISKHNQDLLLQCKPLSIVVEDCMCNNKKLANCDEIALTATIETKETHKSNLSKRSQALLFQCKPLNVVIADCMHKNKRKTFNFATDSNISMPLNIDDSIFENFSGISSKSPKKKWKRGPKFLYFSKLVLPKSVPQAVAHAFRSLESTTFTPFNLNLITVELTDVLTNEAFVSDSNDIIFFVLTYLSRMSRNPIRLFGPMRDPSLIFPPIEDCIVSTLLRIDSFTKLQFEGFLSSVVINIREIVLGVNKISLAGCCALCRVFTKICQLKKNEIEPLSFCCEILKIKHRFAPLLIGCIAAVWKELFNTSYDMPEEVIFYGSLVLGTQKSEIVDQDDDGLSEDEWNIAQNLVEEFVAVSHVSPTKKTVDFLIELIKERCIDAYSSDYMLTTPLVIFTSHKGWKWAKKYIVDKHLLPLIFKYAEEERNERAFTLFCKLYVEILFFCPEKYRPENFFLKFFVAGSKDDNMKYIRDVAATSLIQLMLARNLSIPDDIKEWLESNESNPKFPFLKYVCHRGILKIKDEFTKRDII